MNEKDDFVRFPTSEGKPRRQVKSEELFSPGTTELWILHGAESYRLQLTKNGKLILTK
jgi:hemin uptake protein HemP